MGSRLSLISVAILITGCAHFGGSRVPAASPDATWRACEKMSPTELATFQQIIKSNLGVGVSMARLSKLAHLLGEDENLYRQKKLTLESFLYEDDEGARKGERKTRPPEWFFKSLETFTMVILGDCALVREGLAPNQRIARLKTKSPWTWKELTRFCGPDDSRIPDASAAHPGVVRAWDPSATNAAIRYRFEVEKLNGLRGDDADPARGADAKPGDGAPPPPESFVDACVAFKAKNNIEDVVEDLYLCLDATLVSTQEYDYSTKQYMVDDEGKPKRKTRSRVLQECLKGVAQDKILVSDEGKPLGPKQVAQATAVGSSGTPGAGGGNSSESGNGSGNGNGAGNSNSNGNSSGNGSRGTGGAAGPFGTSAGGGSSSGGGSGASGAGGGGGSASARYCLPGDKDGIGKCDDDKCVRELAWRARKQLIPLPQDLTSIAMLDHYGDERPDYVYRLAKAQAVALAQGYIHAAFQRSFGAEAGDASRGPSAYDQNLRQFVAACGQKKLRGELGEMMRKEYLDPRSVAAPYDGSYGDRPEKLTWLQRQLFEKAGIKMEEDPPGAAQGEADADPANAAMESAYLAQHDAATYKGDSMLAATRQITALRRLVSYLYFDFGGPEVSMRQAPDWFRWLPMLRYMVTQPISEAFHDARHQNKAAVSIDFGDQHLYQCGLFRTLIDDPVPADRKLRTEADGQIAALLGDRAFWNTAFCTQPNQCEPPADFAAYLAMIDLKNLDGSRKVYPSEVCHTRWQAAQSLTGLELSIVARNPALGHAEPDPSDPEKPAPPLFDRILEKTGTDASIAAFAASEAERALPKIQADLRGYLSRLCGDLDSGKMESAYMALLDRRLLGGFDYCDGMPADQASRFGIGCRERASFLACKLQDEAEDWQAAEATPKCLVEVGLVGLDALTVYSIASGAISAALTWRGALSGGIGGLAFTGLNYGVTYALARAHDSKWNDYRAGSAGAVVEGVDSYTDALLEIAATQPRASLHDFLVGFALGALMSGERPKLGASGGAERFAAKAGEIVDSRAASGRFDAVKVSELKNAGIEGAGKDPTLPFQEIRALARIYDTSYAKALEGPKGRIAAARLHRALTVWLRSSAESLRSRLNAIRSMVSLKRLKGQEPTPAELAAARERLAPEDLAEAASQLGPRATAALAEQADAAAAPLPGETEGAWNARVVEFSQKFEEAVAGCPGPSCEPSFERAFFKLTDALRRVYEALDDRISRVRNRVGRAQAEDVLRAIEEKQEQARVLAHQRVSDNGTISEANTADGGNAVGGNTPWPKVIDNWTQDLLARLKTAPGSVTETELLAFAAAKDPRFGAATMDYLTNHGSIQFRVLARFREKIPGYKGSAPKAGHAFWRLWREKIGLPWRRAATAEDLDLFLREITREVGRSLYTRPFWSRWADVILSVKPTANLLEYSRAFAERLSYDYENNYKPLVESPVDSNDSRIDPKLQDEFVRKGLPNVVYRVLGVVAAQFKGGIVPTRAKLLEDPEIVKLSYNVMFFARPVIGGLALWISLETLPDAWGEYWAYKKLQNDINDAMNGSDPHSAVAQKQTAVEDQSFQAKLPLLEREARELEADVAAHPDAPDTPKKRRHLRIIQSKIRDLRGFLKEDEDERQRLKTANPNTTH